MANSLIVSVGADQENPGKFYWDIKDRGLNPILLQRGFDTLEDAQKSLKKFKQDLIKADIILNC